MSNGLPEWIWSKNSAELNAMPLNTLPDVSSTTSSLICSPSLPTSLLVPKSVTRRVQNIGFVLPGPKGLNLRRSVRNSGVISLNVRYASMSSSGVSWSVRMLALTYSSNRRVNSGMFSSFSESPTA